ncbi:response regulator [Billgrantia endophytica]|uniref:DNA-binding response regulator n=1 Tax=Billgrantia endophytica TaxID=2033802 RepID=A0A2N7TXS0_9GAMM|nr:response regulator [Halomonas endophytica]PMR72984.1 DNA-binding response regulator [Halomonas endophytica]
MDVAGVVLVDDHPLFRRGVAELLTESQRFEVLAEFDTAQELLPSLDRLHPELILLDLQMPGTDGMALLERIKSLHDDVWVVMLTASDSSDHLLRAIQLGADGYLLKDTDPDIILERLEAVLEGKVGLNDEMVMMLAQRLRSERSRACAGVDDVPPDWPAALTERECLTLRWIAKGLSNKLIAREMGISDSTVKVYVKNLLRKLNLRSRLELAAWVHAHPLPPEGEPT